MRSTVDGMGELRQLVRVAADQAGGYRTLAGRSMGRISPSTLNNIATGRHGGTMRGEQLAGLAMVIGRSGPDVARLLGQPYADLGQPFLLPERANALSRSQRKVVLSVVDAILIAAQGAEATEATPHLRSVAANRRGTAGQAQQEAKDQAVKARRKQESE